VVEGPPITKWRLKWPSSNQGGALALVLFCPIEDSEIIFFYDAL
jgi:hypothetical protein